VQVACTSLFLAVGLIAERDWEAAQRSWGRGMKIDDWHIVVKRGHRSRGLWPKTSQRMTPYAPLRLIM